MRQFGLSRVIKLGSNENPLGLPAHAREAITRALDWIHHYPDGESSRLRALLAERLGLTPSHFCFANSVDNVLTCLGLAFFEAGDRVVTARPTYTAYGNLAKVMGAHLVEVPLADWRYDVRAVAEAAGAAKAVFVCNPNNPTGSALHHQELQELLDRIPPQALVVLDEAYAEWADDPAFPNAVALLRRHPNLVVLRTFSKIYGLAGLRVGYAVAEPEIISCLNQVREAYRRAAFQNNLEGRVFLGEQLTEMGLRHLPTQANFILVNLGQPAAEVAQRLLERGVIIRPGGLWRLPAWARITIGTPEENVQLLVALSAVLRQQ